MIKETPKILTSVQNPLVKHWVRIRENRTYRQESGSVLISGKKLVEEVGHLTPLKALIVKKDSPLPSLPSEENYFVTEEILKKVTGIPSPEPLAAEVALPLFHSFKNKKRILICDGISDPGNLGTLLRTALALGWEGAFLLSPTVDPFNEKVIRASKGAVFALPLQEGNLEEFQEVLKENELHPFVADLDAPPFTSLKIPQKIALILGSESHGASKEIKKIAQAISIPIEKSMESLNVGVAGGILMYFLTQGLKK